MVKYDILRTMEGPSLVILREELQPFLNKKVLAVSGNTKEAKETLLGKKLSLIDSWGKVLVLGFNSTRKKSETLFTRTHFMMFGSYRINDPKENRVPRLELKFSNGTVYFYACSLRILAEDPRLSLDRHIDLMSKEWDSNFVLDELKKRKSAKLCDLLVDQSIFAGSGNIVKNEVLFNLRLHPLTKLSSIPKTQWPKVISAVHEYMWNFYEWKKKFELRRHWQVYRNFKCPICGASLKRKKLGVFQRSTFYCEKHQPLAKKLRTVKVHEVLPPRIPRRVKEKRLDH
jgi:endonuclease-8